MSPTHIALFADCAPAKWRLQQTCRGSRIKDRRTASTVSDALCTAFASGPPLARSVFRLSMKLYQVLLCAALPWVAGWRRWTSTSSSETAPSLAAVQPVSSDGNPAYSSVFNPGGPQNSYGQQGPPYGGPQYSGGSWNGGPQQSGGSWGGPQASGGSKFDGDPSFDSGGGGGSSSYGGTQQYNGGGQYGAPPQQYGQQLPQQPSYGGGEYGGGPQSSYGGPQSGGYGQPGLGGPPQGGFGGGPPQFGGPLPPQQQQSQWDGRQQGTPPPQPQQLASQSGHAPAYASQPMQPLAHGPGPHPGETPPLALSPATPPAGAANRASACLC